MAYFIVDRFVYDNVSLNIVGFLNFANSVQLLAGGTGLPAGGTIGQALVKNSSTDGDASWQNLAGGGDMLLGTAQNVTAAKSFNNNTLILNGSTSGTTTFQAQAVAGAGTVIAPTSGTLATRNGAETLLNKTADALILTGIPVYSGASITTYAAMGALAIDTSKPNSKSISANADMTFLGTPIAGQRFTAKINNTSGSSVVVKIPSCFSMALQSTVTALTIAANGRVLLTFEFNGGSDYSLWGDV